MTEQRHANEGEQVRGSTGTALKRRGILAAAGAAVAGIVAKQTSAARVAAGLDVGDGQHGDRRHDDDHRRCRLPEHGNSRSTPRRPPRTCSTSTPSGGTGSSPARESMAMGATRSRARTPVWACKGPAATAALNGRRGQGRGEGASMPPGERRHRRRWRRKPKGVAGRAGCAAATASMQGRARARRRARSMDQQIPEHRRARRRHGRLIGSRRGTGG